MRGMNSGVIDMIYLDPPFNSKKNYNNPIGGDLDFKDKWTLDDYDEAEHGLLAEHSPAAHAVIEAVKYAHGKGAMAYCIFMAVRILEMKRILKPDTGHIFLHCDDSAGHYIKALLDAILGKRSYRNHITWERSVPHNDSKRTFGRTSDFIFHYAMPKAKFNPVYESPDQEYAKQQYRYDDHDGRGPYQRISLVNPHFGGYVYEWKGYMPPAKGWRCPKKTMQEYHDLGILYYPVNRDGSPAHQKRLRKKRYLTEYEGAVMGNIWTDIPPLHPDDPENMKYRTQKPPMLMHRIIKCSTKEGDLVFDPFCGCASLLVAAEDLQRDWAGCDLSPKAVDMLVNRIVDRKDLLRRADIADLKKPSVRNDVETIANYRTHKQKLFGTQKGICNGCHFPYPFNVLEVDHIQPKSRSGQDNIENLQLLCCQCNSRKNKRTMAEWIADREKNEPEKFKMEEERRKANERAWKKIAA